MKNLIKEEWFSNLEELNQCIEDYNLTQVNVINVQIVNVYDFSAANRKYVLFYCK
jgi:hypothetical protein